MTESNNTNSFLHTVRGNEICAKKRRYLQQRKRDEIDVIDCPRGGSDVSQSEKRAGLHLPAP